MTEGLNLETAQQKLTAKASYMRWAAEEARSSGLVQAANSLTEDAQLYDYAAEQLWRLKDLED